MENTFGLGLLAASCQLLSLAGGEKNPMGFTHLGRNQEDVRGFSPNSINHLAGRATECDGILFGCVSVCGGVGGGGGGGDGLGLD